MIAPIDKIKSLLSEEIVTLFGDDVIDNSYDEAMKFVLSILSSKTLITELSTHFGETTNRWYATDSANIVLNKFLKNRRILKVEREHTADTDVYYEATELNFLNTKSLQIVVVYTMKIIYIDLNGMEMLVVI